MGAVARTERHHTRGFEDMRSAYKGIAHAIAVCVVLQAAWIALGTFWLFSDVEDGAIVTEDYDYNAGQALHSVFGMMLIPLLAIALLVVSLLAKVPGGTKWAGFVFLAVVVQVVLAILSYAVPALGVLHGLNAFVLIGVAELAARRVGASPAVTTTTEAAAV